MGRQDVISVPQNLLVAEAGQVPKFHCCDLGADFGDAVHAIFISLHKAGKPADQGETQEVSVSDIEVLICAHVLFDIQSVFAQPLLSLCL